jgi:hypothetical protein
LSGSPACWPAWNWRASRPRSCPISENSRNRSGVSAERRKLKMRLLQRIQFVQFTSKIFNREIRQTRENKIGFSVRVFRVVRGQSFFFQFVPPPVRVKFFA